MYSFSEAKIRFFTRLSKIELDEERNRILNLYRMFRHNYRGVMNYAQDFYIGDVLALQCNDNTGFFLPAE